MSRHLFIIGAQRCGTTSLAMALDSHPGVRFAKPFWPEPKYLLRPDEEIDATAYEKHYFQGVAADIVRAEKSTSYIEYAVVARRIKQHFPAARCIVLLRDPVQRAISNYWFSVKHGFEKRSPEEALSPSNQCSKNVAGLSVSPFAYLQRGCYLGYLIEYVAELGRENLLAVQTENLGKDAHIWEKIHDFLGLDHYPTPSGQNISANELVRARAVSERTENILAAYFESHNQALAKQFDIDLDLWQAPK